MQREMWFLAGSECGENAGKVCKLVRAFYILKSSVSSCRELLSHFIQEELRFLPTIIDPYVKIIKKYNCDKNPYWYYFLICVDDVLVVSHLT